MQKKRNRSTLLMSVIIRTLMLKNLQEEKKLIDNWLLNFLTSKEQEFKQQILAKEAFIIIKDFVTSGKTIRGSLFLLASKTVDQKNYETNQVDFLAIASALELIHSSLLVHDDIIDQDEMRRGQDSVWQKYTKNALKKDYKNPQNYGQSMAICLGNILNYLANEALNEISNLPKTTVDKIRSIIDQEIIKTNFAEMLDSKITLQNELPLENEVLQMYLFKTARYTFSLPLQLAGVVSQLNTLEIEKLVKIGEKLGLIFQIKDDQISIFSTEQESGKSFASDIKEGKKTLLYLTLIKNTNQLEQQFINKNLGDKKINSENIVKIQKLFNKYTSKNFEETIKQLKKEAEIKIEEIVSENLTELLKKILDFNLNRKF